MNFEIRIKKEIDTITKDIQKHKNQETDLGQRVDLLDGDDKIYIVCIRGPKDTPYENGYFNLTQQQPKSQPMDPPKVQFQTDVWHPNINEGNICLNILKQGHKESWSPIMKIEQVLISLQQLLSDPNPDDPLNNSAAEQYKKDITQFKNKAREYTNKYATYEKCEIRDW